MKQFVFLISITISLLSCNNTSNNWNSNKDIEILHAKIDKSKIDLEKRYLLNPQKTYNYYRIFKNISEIITKINLHISNKDFEFLEVDITELHNLILKNSFFNSDDFLQKIISIRFEEYTDENQNWTNSKLDLLKWDLLNLENDLISFLKNDIEKDYFKFNKLIPVVVDSSRSVKIGEVYSAKIYLAAVDTTMAPVFYITDLNQPDSIFTNIHKNKDVIDSIIVMNGAGYYNFMVNSVGKKGFKGMAGFRNEHGMNGFVFTHEFYGIEK